MSRPRAVASLAAVTAALTGGGAAAPLAGAVGEGPEQQAMSVPTIFSHHRTSTHICFAGGQFGTPPSLVIIDGAGCNDVYAPIPVHVGGAVGVRTLPSARAVTLQAVAHAGTRAAILRRARCTAAGAGRWTCPFPRVADARGASVSVVYPAAEGRWGFDVAVHRHSRRGR